MRSRCKRCREPKGERRKTPYCESCEAQMECGIPALKWAGKAQCPRCRDLGLSVKRSTFWSPNRRKFRHCRTHRVWLEQQEAGLGQYGDRYNATERKGIDGKSMYWLVRNKLQSKHGRQVRALDQRAILANLHAKEIVGVEYTQWTPQQIAKVYTPAYIADLFARAEANARVMYSGLWEVKTL